tara:strand:+ start:3496 stop:3876 length:381 start_codon:yes stop_codon:yes gene_type:complete
MFKKLKYKIVHRYAMGEERDRGNRDAEIKVYGLMNALTTKYMPLGVMSLHQVHAFMAIIVDKPGQPDLHPDYSKVMKMVDPHSRENDLSDGVVVGASTTVTKTHFVSFLEKYDPNNQNLIILKEVK